MNSHEKHERAQRGITAVLCLLAALLHSPSALAADSSAPASLLRIVGPVRLSPEPGPKLDGQILETRRILERFDKAGFNRAVWAVDALPKAETNIAAWTKTCLAAFPQKPILALDTKPERPLDPQSLKVFLKQALPQAHSVMANYESLSNCSCRERPKEAIAQVRKHLDRVKSSGPSAFVWLLLDDCPKSADNIPEWTAKLGKLVDGYQLWHRHGTNLAADAPPKAIEPLLSGPKPVIRGGLVYIAPRVRPGIEADLREQYRNRMDQYEAALLASGYRGYCRLLGASIPGEVDANDSLIFP